MKINRIIASLAMGAAVLITMASTTEVNLSAYGIKPNKPTDTTLSARIAKALDKAQSRVKTDTLVVKLAPGKYYFAATKHNQHTLYISNHDQNQPKHVGIMLEGCTKLVFDGQGAELLFDDTDMLPVAMKGCDGVTLRNVSIDFLRPHIGQATILTNDTINGVITYAPASEMDWEVRDGRLVMKGRGWEIVPCVGMAFEPDTRHIVYNTSDILVGAENVSVVEPGVISAPWRDKRLVPGTIVALRNYDRPAPAIFSDGCKNVSLYNVKVHYAQGMGLLAQNTHNITLDGFGVCLRNDTERVFTTQADATHFSACSGEIVSVNGLYEGMMDDAINVHGTYLKIVECIDSTTLIGRYMHGQSYGFEWGSVGDSVQLLFSRTMDVVGSEMAVTAIEPVEATGDDALKLWRITLSQPIPDIIDGNAGAGIENLTRTPAVLFANNVVRNNRARGCLFSTPRTVVCRDNLFDHTSGAAILLAGDCNGWYETGACRDVTITGNRFINALTSLFQFTNAIISIYPEIPDLAGQQQYFHSNVKIEGNEFHTFDVPLLYAKSVNGLTFMNNAVVRTTDYHPFHWNHSPILLERVNNARLQ